MFPAVFGAFHNHRAFAHDARRALLLVTLASFLPASALQAASPPATAIAPSTPRFQWRLVLPEDDHTTPADEFTDPDNPTQNLRVARSILLDQSALVGARVDPVDAEHPTVNITFTQEGNKTVAAITRDHLKERLAIIVDGKLIFAPIIQAQITGGQMSISFGRGTPASEVEKLAATLDATTHVFPASAPALTRVPVRILNINIDPHRLQAYGLTEAEVLDAIKKQGLLPDVTPKIAHPLDASVIPVPVASAPLPDPEALISKLNGLVIKTVDGARVRVSDVATLTLLSPTTNPAGTASAPASSP